MNVLCFGYRKWALQIYYKLKDHLPDNTYTIISSEKIKDITSIVKSLNPYFMDGVIISPIIFLQTGSV